MSEKKIIIETERENRNKSGSSLRRLYVCSYDSHRYFIFLRISTSQKKYSREVFWFKHMRDRGKKNKHMIFLCTGVCFFCLSLRIWPLIFFWPALFLITDESKHENWNNVILPQNYRRSMTLICWMISLSS